MSWQSKCFNDKGLDRNFIQCRYQLRKQLRKLFVFFKYDQNFTVENILFPNAWIKQSPKSNPNHYRINKRNFNKSIQILKQVVKFVYATKRFKNEKYGI